MTVQDRARDNLTTSRVVALYRKHSKCNLSVDELLERVHEATADEVPSAPSTDARPVATDGGTD
ncbi:hypothetical protein [Natrinema halophilum]|uniref:hypothetical protein n=1 Tax=Natrinema halophilum TaxID=1699371 RepID=UPI001F1DDBD7|nr:hypothetical protein [Natrinema halophilum]UHQ96332.1 hypothetical protein HYG82_21990 [Natrinema halophilum]